MLVNRTHRRLGLAGIIGASLLFSSGISSSQQAERGPMRYETTIEQVTYAAERAGSSVLVVRDGEGRCFAHMYSHTNLIKGAERANALSQAKEDGSTVILTADPDLSQRSEYRNACCLYLSGIEIREKEE